jgi:hypothetical protein
MEVATWSITFKLQLTSLTSNNVYRGIDINGHRALEQSDDDDDDYDALVIIIFILVHTLPGS